METEQIHWRNNLVLREFPDARATVKNKAKKKWEDEGDSLRKKSVIYSHWSTSYASLCMVLFYYFSL